MAQIITALCGVGIDCGEDARFIKNGKWPMTGLFQYYMPEGGFMPVALTVNPLAMPFTFDAVTATW